MKKHIKNNTQKELCFKLRAETGIGLMDCKKCLETNNWNYDNAKKNYRNFIRNIKL